MSFMGAGGWFFGFVLLFFCLLLLSILSIYFLVAIDCTFFCD